MESGYVNVAAESDLGEGEVLGVAVGDKKVVIIRLQGNVYALGAVCTHMGADLAGGWLEEDFIRCPWHKSGFDVRTGKAVRPPAREPEPSYEVRVEDGRIWVSETPREAAG